MTQTAPDYTNHPFARACNQPFVDNLERGFYILQTLVDAFIRGGLSRSSMEGRSIKFAQSDLYSEARIPSAYEGFQWEVTGDFDKSFSQKSPVEKMKLDTGGLHEVVLARLMHNVSDFIRDHDIDLRKTTDSEKCDVVFKMSVRADMFGIGHDHAAKEYVFEMLVTPNRLVFRTHSNTVERVQNKSSGEFFFRPAEMFQNVESLELDKGITSSVQIMNAAEPLLEKFVGMIKEECKQNPAPADSRAVNAKRVAQLPWFKTICP